jgi:septal ring factor EnvC (AmiA/AmiB activator)
MIPLILCLSSANILRFPQVVDLKEEFSATQHNALYTSDRLESEREQMSRVQRELEETKVRFHDSDRARINLEQELEQARANLRGSSFAFNLDAASDISEDADGESTVRPPPPSW